MALLVASLIAVVQRSGRPPTGRTGGGQRMARTRRTRRIPALPSPGRCRDPPPRVDPSCLPPTEQAIHSALRERASVTILRLDSPTGLPVVLVRADGRGGGLAFGSARSRRSSDGGAPGPDRSSGADGYEPAIIEPRQVRTPADHAALYSDPARRQRLDWMLRGTVVDLAAFPATRRDRLPPRACHLLLPCGRNAYPRNPGPRPVADPAHLRLRYRPGRASRPDRAVATLRTVCIRASGTTRARVRPVAEPRS